jgi:DNA repair protein RadC
VMKKEPSPGHRKRLREKFLRSGLSGFQDYEIIELLLTLGSPRRDCKQQAKEVLRRFKTLRGALSASLEELAEIEGVGPHAAFGIKLVQEVAAEFLRQKIIDKPVYKTGREIFDYLYHSMRDLKTELFKVIYLNSQNQIIDIIDLFEGTVNASSIYPREIMKAAIKHDAVSLIFVHNHPSGDPQASDDDVNLTKRLAEAGGIIGIDVLDHIIIGDRKYLSLKREGVF